MLLVTALFTKNVGEPAIGLTLADIDMYLFRRLKTTGVVSTVWNAVNPTEEIGGGLYSRALSTDDPTTYDYFSYTQYTGATVLDTNYSLQSGDGGVTEEEIWTYTTRTLTQAAATAATTGTVDITIIRGDTMSVPITGMGDLSSYVSLDFTVKEEKQDTDDNAIMHIRKNASGVGDGLLRFNKAEAADATKGGITIDDLVAGDITMTLAADLTDDLAADSGLYHDVQEITATTVTTKADGRFTVIADVTRAVA